MVHIRAGYDRYADELTDQVKGASDLSLVACDGIMLDADVQLNEIRGAVRYIYQEARVGGNQAG